ncbi:MAG: PTS system mannose/fructose/sorbose family transporter subunit IID [Erysipelotrichaceae bacterium]|nr:PTS system mannose/fructose/sorbose family transporter subunit IID [Erysipelotrichaceae bacterium]MDY5251589.1 PTS system mannose/fructose/sorbose family transporter subunit IID [Erysipelotrichaceae bacterium]
MTNVLTKEDKKLINGLFWGSFLLEACYNYERQQALGFCVGMEPAIKRFYKTKEEQAEALTRHMAIFNTTPHVSGLISGVAAAMEKEASENPNFDKSAINNVKVGLMGPMAGIGDSFFWGTFRVIASGIGISLAQQGSPLAPIVFLVLFNIPHILVRYFGTKYGYMFGTKLMSNIKENDIIQTISKAATIVGLMVIGGMTASMVVMTTSLSVTIGDTTFAIQTYLDQIFPLLLPFVYTLAMFGLLKKGLKSTHILLITIAVGIIGSLVGFF